MSNNDILGKIKRAQSVEEIAALLAQVAMFEHASPKTVRRCQKFANRRKAELEDEK